MGSSLSFGFGRIRRRPLRQGVSVAGNAARPKTSIRKIYRISDRNAGNVHKRTGSGHKRRRIKFFAKEDGL